MKFDSKTCRADQGVGGGGGVSRIGWLATPLSYSPPKKRIHVFTEKNGNTWVPKKNVEILAIAMYANANFHL